MKKITRVFLCVTMSLCVSFVYSQQESVPDTIWNEEDFWAMSPDGNYIQGNNLLFRNDFALNSETFSGSYDGNGFTISSRVDRSSPLFPKISGLVKNIIVYNISVYGNGEENCAIITSELQEGGRIENITAQNIVVADARNVGIIAGAMSGGVIAFCNVVSILGIDDATGLTANNGGGGLVGCMTNGHVHNCYLLTGGRHPSAIAGVVGLVDNTNPNDTAIIESCYWQGFMGLQGGDLTFESDGKIRISAIANVLNPEMDNVTIRSCYFEPPSNNNIEVSRYNDNIQNCYPSAGVSERTGQNLADYLNTGLDVPGFLFDGNHLFVNMGEVLYTVRDGFFNQFSTWGDYPYNHSILKEIHIRHQLDIPRGETMIIPAYADVIVTDEGWTTIEDGANLLLCGDEREITNVKVKKNLSGNEWNFVGFPNVESVSPLANVDYDIWALPFDYASNAWSEDHFLHWNSQVHDTVSRGNGIFVWPENDGEVTAETDGIHIEKNIVVTKDIQGSLNGNGYWMALANPYLGKLEVAKFVNDNTDRIQGRIVYLYNGTSFNTQETIPATVPVGEGFFVNMVSNGMQTIDFKPSQMVGYPSAEAKTVTREREYVQVSVSTDGYKVPVMICQNDLASEEYDIFDANKMFGDGSVAEPYFVTEGINLCKEEINSMPYYATMNIKSGEARTVEIVADAIPEGYSATLIDGDEEVELTEGMVYTTDIASGENAERFKLLIGEKNVSLESAETIENLIRVSNTGRRVNISAQGAIDVEVYNALGQKVYSTTDNSFTLDGVSAGAYVIKVSNGKSVKSEKIIVQ